MCPYGLHSHVIMNGIMTTNLVMGVVIFAMFWRSATIRYRPIWQLPDQNIKRPLDTNLSSDHQIII
jgi:hypothetical protein